jgi:hypothetical protein
LIQEDETKTMGGETGQSRAEEVTGCSTVNLENLQFFATLLI